MHTMVETNKWEAETLLQLWIDWKTQFQSPGGWRLRGFFPNRESIEIELDDIERMGLMPSVQEVRVVQSLTFRRK